MPEIRRKLKSKRRWNSNIKMGLQLVWCQRMNWAQLVWLMFVEKDLIAAEARDFSLHQNAHPALEPTQPLIKLEGLAVSPRGLSDRSAKLTTWPLSGADFKNEYSCVSRRRGQLVTTLFCYLEYDSGWQRLLLNPHVAKLQCLGKTIQTKLTSSSRLRLKS
jgi:hypothetical protein